MKRKGFTLIELLAVIVILAIIALIATPIVLDIIDDSKTSSVKRSVELYLDGVEQAVARYQLNGQVVNNGQYYVTAKGNLCSLNLENNECPGKEISVTVNGNKPTSGTIILKEGSIQTYRNLKLNNNTYVTKNANESDISETLKPLCKPVTKSTTGNIPTG